MASVRYSSLGCVQCVQKDRSVSTAAMQDEAGKMSMVVLGLCRTKGGVLGNNDLVLGALSALAAGTSLRIRSAALKQQQKTGANDIVKASWFLPEPAVGVIRLLVFYALVQMGVAGRASAISVSEKGQDSTLPSWFQIFSGLDREAEKKRELLKLTSKWHSSTKGTLVRRFRVARMAEGRRLLNSICSLLSEDDSFRDASSHKGCQMRRENAHAESVCCNNVRALLDELPTPHLVVEITVFPPGPISEVHYEKAQKLEKVLRTGLSI